MADYTWPRRQRKQMRVGSTTTFQWVSTIGAVSAVGRLSLPPTELKCAVLEKNDDGSYSPTAQRISVAFHDPSLNLAAGTPVLVGLVDGQYTHFWINCSVDPAFTSQTEFACRFKWDGTSWSLIDDGCGTGKTATAPATSGTTVGEIKFGTCVV